MCVFAFFKRRKGNLDNPVRVCVALIQWVTKAQWSVSFGEKQSLFSFFRIPTVEKQNEGNNRAKHFQHQIVFSILEKVSWVYAGKALICLQTSFQETPCFNHWQNVKGKMVIFDQSSIRRTISTVNGLDSGHRHIFNIKRQNRKWGVPNNKYRHKGEERHQRGSSVWLVVDIR